MFIRILLLFTLIIGNINAAEKSLWYKQNNQQNWTKRYDRSKMAKSYLKESAIKRGAASFDIKKESILTKAGLKRKLKEKEEASNSARSRLKEMQACEKKAKSKEERKKCWFTPKQIAFQKKQTNIGKYIKQMETNKLKSLESRYVKQMKYNESNFKRNNYVPDWNKVSERYYKGTRK